MSKRGKLIVIEGTDSSGKETQTNLLYNRLNINENIPTEKLRFPFYEGNVSGRIVGQCYLGKKDLGEKLGWEGDYAWFGNNPNKIDPKLASIFYAGDRFEASNLIYDCIDKGKNLILDRYYQSNMAHQGSKYSDSAERDKLFNKLKLLEFDYFEIPKEDKTILLYLPTEIAFKLRNKRDGGKENLDIHENDKEYLKRTEETYLQLAEKFNWDLIDCTDYKNKWILSREEIHNKVYNSIKNLFD